MKKIFILLFVTGVVATGLYSCSKDDNTSNNNNNNNNNNNSVDVWAKAVGTYKGESVDSSGGTQNTLVIVEKISETRVRVKPGAGNTIITLSEFDVYKTDSLLKVAPGGGFDGAFEINAKKTSPDLIFAKNNPSISFYGFKQ